MEIVKILQFLRIANDVAPQKCRELQYFCLIPCRNWFLHILSQKKLHQNYYINIPQKWGKMESQISQ